MIHRHLARRCNLHARSPAIKLHSCAAARQQQQQQQGGLLTRDFIAKSLYNQDTGYFSTKDVLNDLPGPLEYGSMMGELHYRLDVKKAYESKLSAWMTPVETFSPHFSHALARFIAKEASSACTISPRRASPPGRKRGANDGSSSGGGGGRHGGGQDLVLYEAGGGTGTNALNVLDWLRREEPKLYERTEYTIVEISPRLAELQTERVCSVHQNCRVVNANVLEWGMSGEVDPRPCFFLGMELLDNLPHDKIAWVAPSYQRTQDENGRDSTVSPRADEERKDGEEKEEERQEEEAEEEEEKKQLCEAVVVESPEGGFREVFRPLRDPVIRELLTICPELASMVRSRGSLSTEKAEAESGSSPLARVFGSTIKLPSLFGLGAGGADALRPEHCAAFVPTGSLRLMQALRKRLPRHRAILADFDSFAGSAGAEEGGGAAHVSDESLTAFQAPIVSSRDPETGSVTDHATYMVPLGSADIFFPTCFERLARLHAAVCRGGSSSGGGDGGVRRGRGLVVKQGEFLREFADLHSTRTFSGFNPLVDDFRNSSVFLSGAVLGS